MRFDGYQIGEFFDEMFAAPGEPRPGCAPIVERIEALSDGELLRRQRAAESALMDMGVTFSVYGEEQGNERIIPFDLVPRIVPAKDWDLIDRGLKQRITALNMFVQDVYNDAAILKDGVVPEAVLRGAASYRKECEGITPPRGVWCQITGTDLVRDADGKMLVLEDNLRSPSGASYVLENRRLLKRTFPEAFEASGVRPVEEYPSRLLEVLSSLAPAGVDDPTVVVLTPGVFNSAYFEHSFLAQEMGVELVEGRDLVVEGKFLYMRTTKGFRRVDVVYRRIDDDFLDPLVFRADSTLGVDGLFDVWRSGRVALASAPGTGVADDKVLYASVPDMIRYYLSEEPMLPNVETYACWDDQQRAYVLEHLDELVVKTANDSGGYGMLIGPHSTADEREEFAKRIEAEPRTYIAQPVVSLSRAPVIVGDRFEGRHVDLRPYVLYGEDIWVVPGGLTRVALRPGNLVVNSSQGGGSKDTWVLTG
ncbi:MAG: circularly permuted type 2 ATP-grasp protein [Actinomycetota bacterium]